MDKIVPQWSVGLGFTSQCNMSCDFCYSRARRQQSELPVRAWQEFFRQYNRHIGAVNFGTGESALVDGWFSLVEFVRDRYPHIMQAVTTNGSLIRAVQRPRNRAVVLKSIDEIDVSLDFADRQRHDIQRGFAGAFDMAVETAAFCRAHQKKVTFVMIGLDATLTPSNLESVFGLAHEVGAYVRINLYRPVPGTRTPSPSSQRVREGVDWLFRHHDAIAVSDPLFIALYCHSDGSHGDPSGHSSLRILPDGQITPSTYLIGQEWVAGHIDMPNLFERLVASPQFRAFRNPSLPVHCAGCELGITCRGGTPDRRLLVYGTLEEPDPYCPQREGRPPRRPRVAAVVHGNGPAVHGNYLPTLVFRPRS